MFKTIFSSTLFVILFSINAIAQASSRSKSSNAPFLTIAIVQEWDTFHPVAFQTSATESVLHFIMRDMVFRDEAGKVLPELAEKVPSLVNKLARIKNKKIEAEWSIKKEAVWSDGTPITCADWYLGWQVGLSDFVTKSEKNIYSKIVNIEYTKNNPKKCIVTYKDADWTFDRDLPPLLPSHLEEKIFQTKNNRVAEYEQSSYYFTQPTLKGLYSGPYQITDYKRGQYVVFEENPKFYGTKPKIKKIVLKYVSSTNTLRSYLLSGEINAIASIGFPPDLAMHFAEDKDLSHFKVHYKNAPLFQALFVNNQAAIVSDKNVRKALSMAIDKQKLVKAFLNNKLNAAESILSESNQAFIRRDSKYSMIAASEVLEKAGWLKQTDGTRKKNGQILELEFKTSAGLKMHETLQIAICDDFKKIGVMCRIKNEPPRVLLGETILKGTFQLAMFGQSTYPDSSLKGTYHSDEIPQKKNAWAGGNIIRLQSAELDKMLVKYDKEWNVQKRVLILQQIEKIILDDYAIIPIYHRREAFLLPSNLAGLKVGLKGTAIVYPELWSWN